MSENKCIIAVDAMGGDFAPRNVVLGTIQAIKEKPEIEVFLVGPKDRILEELRHLKFHSFPEDHIVHASEVIEMEDKPADSVKNKRDSSIVVGTKMVKQGKAHAFVSAGNTGAVMTAATLILGDRKSVV